MICWQAPANSRQQFCGAVIDAEKWHFVCVCEEHMLTHGEDLSNKLRKKGIFSAGELS